MVFEVATNFLPTVSPQLQQRPGDVVVLAADAAQWREDELLATVAARRSPPPRAPDRAEGPLAGRPILAFRTVEKGSIGIYRDL